MAAFDAKSLVDQHYEAIKSELRQRQGLSLMIRTILAIPGAIQYLAKRLHMPMEYSVSEIYEHYGFKHYTVTEKTKGDPRYADAERNYRILPKIIRDGLMSLVRPDDRIYDMNLFRESIIDAAIDGYYPILWHFQDKIMFESEKDRFIAYFAFGTAIAGKDMDVIKKLEASIEPSYRVPFLVFGAYGALYGGHIDLLTYFCQKLNDIKPKANGQIVFLLSIHDSPDSLNSYFEPELETIGFFLTSPMTQILSLARTGNNLVRDQTVSDVIRLGSYDLLKSLLTAGYITINDLKSAYNKSPGAERLLVEQGF